MALLRDVADFFVETAIIRKEDPITNLRLQKLIYFAQAWHLQRHGIPLFEDDVKAWDLGPVSPSLYWEYSSLRDHPIMDVHPSYDVSHFSTDELETLVDVSSAYGKYRTSELVNMTHEPGGAWDLTPHNAVISKELIRKSFDALPPLPHVGDDPHLFDSIPIYTRFPKEFSSDCL